MIRKSLRMGFIAALATAAFVPSLASAQALDLSRYTLTASFALPGTASESSAITWNWDSDTLFVVGDEGEYITEVSRTGTVIGSMRLTGFDDTEALTYVGNGQFVIGEERIQDVYRLTYQAGTTVARNSLASVSLGGTVGNVGLEGISYDRRDGSFVTVKEKSPQAVRAGGIDFGTGTHTLADLFSPALGVSDLSDVQVLSGFAGTGFADNLLIYSQESQRLLEVTRGGQIVSTFDFTFISGIAEGVTIAGDGTIFITDESPYVYVLSAPPVPEPETYALMLAGLCAVGFIARRRA
ncbi:SdiA-regulated domain-containing protein [Thauera sinica]|uniref:SdiA-regulated domain-containing protein n=1 Tax=Thauera sinica TaxID=2665146 RepID=A0ABW1AL83_9RHOO|nr:SdiA-regulated domain-containing protein [Thauera sp. K11]